jgi:AraC family transcriptional regulator
MLVRHQETAMTLQRAFTVHETHGMLMRPEHTIRSRSDGFGWTSIYASIQNETPYEGTYDGVDDQLIVFHMDGPATVEGIHGARIERCLVPPGGMHLIPGGRDFRVRLMDALTTMHLYIRRAVIEEVAGELVKGDPGRIGIQAQFVASEPAMANALAAVRYELVSGTGAGNLTVDYLSRVLAFSLVRKFSGATPLPLAVIRSASASSAPLRLVLDFMNDHLSQPIGLADLARTARCSPSHLARLFNAALGMPPHRYLVILRIKQAQMLLRTTRLPLSAIAAQCGLSSREHLIKLFRRWCATTPETYRQAFVS